MRTNVAPYVSGDTVILEASGQVPTQTVELQTFLGFFGDAIAGALAGGSSVHAALAATDYQVDAEGVPTRNLGYKAFFDKWKAEGLIA